MNSKQVAGSIGHSNLDPGAIGIDGIKEHCLNVLLFDAIVRLKLDGGFEWVSADINSEHLPYPDHLIKTVETVNLLKPRCCIEIHHNWVARSNVKGIEIIHHPQSIKGRELATAIKNKCKGLHSRIRVLSTDDTGRKSLFIGYRDNNGKFRGTYCPAVVFEAGYLSNAEDIDFVQDKRGEIARAVRDGVNVWLYSQG